MFSPKTTRLDTLQKQDPSTVSKIDSLLTGKVVMHIDYANVRPWSSKLKFHIDPVRLKQFFDSFSQIQKIHYYQGTLRGDIQSESEIKLLVAHEFCVHTKPVKIMRKSIDATSLPSLQSTVLIDDFIRASLLRTFSLASIENLNRHLLSLNQQGTLYLEDRKCNFDVEIGVQMLLELERNEADTFVLWSGDSDFVDPIQKILDAKKKVILFGTAGRISKELNELRTAGLIIYDIFHLKEFLCWKREMRKP